ncbi:MAG: ROK family protein [Spirochaetota bacterium]
MSSEKILIGIDIGGTKCAVVIGTADPPLTASRGRTRSSAQITVIDRTAFPTEAAKGPKKAIARIISAVQAMLVKHSVDRAACRGIGISSGGPLDSDRGVILSPPNLPGWDNVRIVDIMKKEFAVPVRLENDANACALAEHRYGAGVGSKNMIFLTFGTGLGAGLILDGTLYGGTNGMAGEAGHIRLAEHGPVGYGKAGSFEGFCSGGGIAQLARDRVLERTQRGADPGILGTVPVSDITARDVAAAAVRGDVLAKKVLEISGELLGRGLSILIDVLNPDTIVIGSVYARGERFIRPSMMKSLALESLARSRAVCRIVPAQLGEAIGDIAALELARMASLSNG